MLIKTITNLEMLLENADLSNVSLKSMNVLNYSVGMIGNPKSEDRLII